MNARDNKTLKWLRGFLERTLKAGDGAVDGECAKALTLVRRMIETNPRVNTRLNAEMDARSRRGQRAQP
jgi:hypothetical protein